VLGDAGPNQGPDQARNAGPGRRVGEDDAQGAGRDGGPDDRDDTGQHAQAREGAQAQAGEDPGDGARPGVRLVVLGDHGARRRFVVPQDDPDLVLPEPGLAEFADGLIGVASVLENPDDGGPLVSLHEVLSM